MLDRDRPVLKETPGGWMAVAVDSPRIAVVADTEDAALALFCTERAIWRDLIAEVQREHEEPVAEPSSNGVATAQPQPS